MLIDLTTSDHIGTSSIFLFKKSPC